MWCWCVSVGFEVSDAVGSEVERRVYDLVFKNEDCECVYVCVKNERDMLCVTSKL